MLTGRYDSSFKGRSRILKQCEICKEYMLSCFTSTTRRNSNRYTKTPIKWCPTCKRLIVFDKNIKVDYAGQESV